MKEIKKIILGFSENPNINQYGNLIEAYLLKLELKLKESFPELPVSLNDKSILPINVPENPTFLVSVTIQKDSDFGIKIGYNSQSKDSERITSFIKEELRKWICLHACSIEVIQDIPLNSSKLNDNIFYTEIVLHGDDNLIQGKFSDESYADAFSDTISSGIREYINSN